MLFDFRALSARERHRLLISTVVPRPIAWVVTEDPASGINLAPFSFFNVFCEEPALVCLGFGAGERGDGADKDTAANIRRTGEFVVNLVTEATATAMAATAMEVGPEIDEMAAAGLTPAASDAGPPAAHCGEPGGARMPPPQRDRAARRQAAGGGRGAVHAGQ